MGINWTELADDIMPKTNKIPYEPNKHLFTKVAFDVFQLDSSPAESLWMLEDGPDGQQFLVACYGDDEEDSKILESRSHWRALADKEGKNVTLTYKDAPIQRFASSEYGFTNDDVHIFQKVLVEKLSSDQSFVKKFLNLQSEDKRKMLLEQFPELL